MLVCEFAEQCDPSTPLFIWSEDEAFEDIDIWRPDEIAGTEYEDLEIEEFSLIRFGETSRIGLRVS